GAEEDVALVVHRVVHGEHLGMTVDGERDAPHLLRAQVPFARHRREHLEPRTSFDDSHGNLLRHGLTTSAVTMPNMPFSFSAWGRMWQCHTHVPTSVAWTSTV